MTNVIMSAITNSIKISWENEFEADILGFVVGPGDALGVGDGVGERVGEGIVFGVGNGIGEEIEGVDGDGVGEGVGTAAQLHFKTLLQSVMELLRKSLHIQKQRNSEKNNDQSFEKNTTKSKMKYCSAEGNRSTKLIIFQISKRIWF